METRIRSPDRAGYGAMKTLGHRDTFKPTSSDVHAPLNVRRGIGLAGGARPPWGGPRGVHGMTGGRRAYPAILLILLTISALSAAFARADPTIVDEGGGFKRATWDFGGGANYTATNVSLAPSNATLASTTSSKTWFGADFPNWRQSAVRTFANDSGVRLAGNTSNLVRDGTFDQTPGPWTYANGTTGH